MLTNEVLHLRFLKTLNSLIWKVQRRLTVIVLALLTVLSILMLFFPLFNIFNILRKWEAEFLLSLSLGHLEPIPILLGLVLWDNVRFHDLVEILQLFFVLFNFVLIRLMNFYFLGLEDPNIFKIWRFVLFIIVVILWARVFTVLIDAEFGVVLVCILFSDELLPCDFWQKILDDFRIKLGSWIELK